MGAEQRLEAASLVGMGEAVQHDGVLADVGVDVEEHLAPGPPEGGQQRRRHRAPGSRPRPPPQISTSPRARRSTEHTPQRADHGPPPPAAATARRSGWRRQMAHRQRQCIGHVGRAGGSARPRTAATMRCTCSLVARPVADHAPASPRWRCTGPPRTPTRPPPPGPCRGLAGGHGRPGVHLEEHPLDHHGRRAELGHQGPQLARTACAAGRAGASPARSEITPAATRRQRPAPPGDHAVAAARQAGVDAQDEHAFDATCRRWRRRGIPGTPGSGRGGQPLVGGQHRRRGCRSWRRRPARRRGRRAPRCSRSTFFASTLVATATVEVGTIDSSADPSASAGLLEGGAHGRQVGRGAGDRSTARRRRSGPRPRPPWPPP